MKISEIPDEVYTVASKYEGFDVAADLNQAKLFYKSDVDRRGWTEAGLEKAICDYLLKQNDFSYNGKYSECADNSWQG